MTQNNLDAIIRAYPMLKALKERAEQIPAYNIEEIFVHEFHNALDKLEGFGIDVAEFRIPDSELAPIRTGSAGFIPGAPGNPTIYSKEKYVKRQYLLLKIDSVLGYLENIMSPRPKPKMGFDTHKD